MTSSEVVLFNQKLNYVHTHEAKCKYVCIINEVMHEYYMKYNYITICIYAIYYELVKYSKNTALTNLKKKKKNELCDLSIFLITYQNVQ